MHKNSDWKWLYLLLAIGLVLIAGCSNKTAGAPDGIPIVKSETSGKSVVVRSDESVDSGADETENVNQEALEAVKAAVLKQMSAISNRDSQLYMSTINFENEIYHNEAAYFAEGLKRASFESFQMTVKNIDFISDSECEVTIFQSYIQNQELAETTYKESFILKDGLWLDNDVVFKRIDSSPFVIFYTEDVDNPNEFLEMAHKGYANVQSIFADEFEDQITIKLYGNEELLRQKTDLSIEWLFTGWAEEGHAIKAFAGRTASYSYEGLFTHEFIHKVTIGASNGNMPVWFAEGLATEYGSNMVAGGNYLQQGKSTKEQMYMSIVDISRQNLESMTDSNDIRAFYGASAMIVEYLETVYGREKVFELYQRLGEYPYNSPVGNPNWYRNVTQRFEEVVIKVLNKPFDEISEDYMAWYEDKYGL